jgi:ribosomal protein S18 acetylase RimI-like enzyme
MKDCDFESTLGLDDLAQINALLKQLNPKLSLSREKLAELLTQENLFFCVARQDARIVGLGTLVKVTSMHDTMGLIEDIIVDEAFRGQKIGEKIMDQLIKIAKEQAIKFLDLTSNPTREAANRLYQKLGFQLRQVNSYRLFT